MKKLKLILSTALIIFMITPAYILAQQGNQPDTDQAFKNAITQVQNELGSNVSNWTMAARLQKDLPTKLKNNIINRYSGILMGPGAGGGMGLGPCRAGVTPGTGGGLGLGPCGGTGTGMGMGFGMAFGRGIVGEYGTTGPAMVRQLNLTAAQLPDWRRIQAQFAADRRELMARQLPIASHRAEMIQRVTERNKKLEKVLAPEQMKILVRAQNQNRAQMINGLQAMKEALNLTDAELDQLHQIHLAFRSKIKQNMGPGAGMRGQRFARRAQMQQLAREYTDKILGQMNTTQQETWKLHRAVVQQQWQNAQANS